MDSNDWSYDAVDAARLDMGSQVSADLVNNTEKYQTYISGLAAFNQYARRAVYRAGLERRDRAG